jgi:G3E family GTPase
MSPPITIVTGFLGSGKTTLLRAMLKRGAGGRRVALVVNEIGAVGFDGAAIGRAGGAALVELTNGCLCCAGGGDFLYAIEELIAVADPDQIVVEASGLAEPGGLIRQARAAGLPLDALVAVAAAAGLDGALAAAPVATWQLRAADIIVLSKTDLVDAAGRSAAEAALRQINMRAPIVPAAGGELDPQLLFGPRLAADPPAEPDHRAADGFASFVWAGETPLRRDALAATLSGLPPQIYRAKGVVHCGDAPWPDELHYVGGRLALTAFRPPAPAVPLNQLVLIGAGAAAVQAEVCARLDSCAEPAERAAAWAARYRTLF